ncbi:hypothetical protein JCM17960_33510 [Magnetospira thiophila]
MKIEKKDAQDFWFQMTREEVQIVFKALHMAATNTDDKLLKHNIKELAEKMTEVITQ